MRKGAPSSAAAHPSVVAAKRRRTRVKVRGRKLSVGIPLMLGHWGVRHWGSTTLGKYDVREVRRRGSTTPFPRVAFVKPVEPRKFSFPEASQKLPRTFLENSQKSLKKIRVHRNTRRCTAIDRPKLSMQEIKESAAQQHGQCTEWLRGTPCGGTTRCGCIARYL